MAVSHAATSRRPSRARSRRHRRQRRAPGVPRARAGWFVVAVLACGLLAGAAWAAAGTSPGEVAREVGTDRGVPSPRLDAAHAGAAGGGEDRSEPGGGSEQRMALGVAQKPAADAAGRAHPAAGSPSTGGAVGPERREGDGGGPRSATQRAVRVLRGWDRARAAAYAAGSVRSLRELYVAAAGEADVRLLRSYVRRGYRVEDLRMQLVSVRVLRHRPGWWSLRVTDRLAGAVAVGYGERVDLPRDRASTRTITLRRDSSGDWRVVRVRG